MSAALVFLATNGIVPTLDADKAYEIVNGVAAGTHEMTHLVEFFKNAIQSWN